MSEGPRAEIITVVRRERWVSVRFDAKLYIAFGLCRMRDQIDERQRYWGRGFRRGTQDEAKQLVSEIRRTPGWSALSVEPAQWVDQGTDEYRISAMYAPSCWQEWVYDREHWSDLKALWEERSGKSPRWRAAAVPRLPLPFAQR